MVHYKVSVETIYIIGCGGVASWLLPPLLKLLNAVELRPSVVLMDGDIFEDKNIDRQLFDENDIGTNKALALANLYENSYDNLYNTGAYLTDGVDINPQSLFFGCADNHAARKLILSMVDRYDGRAIIGANEYTDAEAYVYEPAWKDSPLDPRVYYPDILSNERGDPTRPTSCQGLAAEATPQLVLANQAAATQMLWLFWFHYIERPKLNRDESFNFWPIRHYNSFSRFGTDLVKDRMAAQPQTKVTE